MLFSKYADVYKLAWHDQLLWPASPLFPATVLGPGVQNVLGKRAWELSMKEGVRKILLKMTFSKTPFLRSENDKVPPLSVHVK